MRLVVLPDPTMALAVLQSSLQMRLGARCAGRCLLALAAIVVLTTPLSAQTIVVDFNGDGVRDRVDSFRGDAVVIVRGADGAPIQRLHTRYPVVGLVVADVNHDGSPDIIVRTSHPGLHVWVNRGGGRFVRARGHVTRAHGARVGRGSMTPRGPDPVGSQAGNVDTAPVLMPDVDAGVGIAWTAGALPRPRAPVSSFSIRPRAPRGPPFSRSTLS